MSDVLASVPDYTFDDVRLDSLAEFVVLDTPPEEGFDSIVELATQLCACPVALVSLVDRDRQWFKARVNFPSCETDLSSSVCAHALVEPDMLVIPDLTADPRTVHNPLVTGEPFIRFYAGAPLVTTEGQVLGSLCVIDKVSRPGGLTTAQRSGLKALARQVMTQLELRRAITARDALRAEEAKTFRIRDALGRAQAAINMADGDLDRVLAITVREARLAIPAAEGGTVQLLDRGELEYRAVEGTLLGHAGLRVPVAGSFTGESVLTRRPHRLADARTDPHGRHDLVAQLRLRSAIVTPILSGDTVLGVLKLQSGVPDAFTHRDLEIIGLFAGAATAGLAEVKARAAARHQDAYWRGLFDRLGEGFIIGEAIRDASGAVTDWRYVEVNPAWGELVGIDPAMAVGRTLRELFPGIEDSWVSDFAHVVETGRPAQFVRQVGATRRWYHGRAFRLEGERFGIIFLEVTQSVEANARRDALLALGDQLRDLASVDAMLMAASGCLGTTLDVQLVGYGDVDPVAETITVARDWTTGGAASLAGTLRFRDFGSYIEDLKADRPVIVVDCRTDPRTQAHAGALEERSARAFVNLPLFERGRFVGLLYVSTGSPRDWSRDEVDFIREVASRTRLAVTRLRAEEQQEVLNHELSHRMKNSLAMVQAIAFQTLRTADKSALAAFNERIHALSAAHEVLLKQRWSSAQIGEVVTAVLGNFGHAGRFDTSGPDIRVGSTTTLSLSLLLHELATNAIKYGSLSTDGGWVMISWRLRGPEGEEELVFNWREVGGPPVVAPSRKGFGSRLIGMGLTGSGAVALAYDVTGLRAEMRAPLAQIQIS